MNAIAEGDDLGQRWHTFSDLFYLLVVLHLDCNGLQQFTLASKDLGGGWSNVSGEW